MNMVISKCFSTSYNTEEFDFCIQLFKIVFKIFHLRGPSASKFYIQPEIHFSNFLAALYIYLQCPYNCKLVIIL